MNNTPGRPGHTEPDGAPGPLRGFQRLRERPRAGAVHRQQRHTTRQHPAALAQQTPILHIRRSLRPRTHPAPAPVIHVTAEPMHRRPTRSHSSRTPLHREPRMRLPTLPARRVAVVDVPLIRSLRPTRLKPPTGAHDAPAAAAPPAPRAAAANPSTPHPEAAAHPRAHRNAPPPGSQRAPDLRRVILRQRLRAHILAAPAHLPRTAAVHGLATAAPVGVETAVVRTPAERTRRNLRLRGTAPAPGEEPAYQHPRQRDQRTLDHDAPSPNRGVCHDAASAARVARAVRA